MNVWTNKQFTGCYPVGTAAVVAAQTRKKAAELLNAELVKIGLDPTAKPDQFRRFDTTKQRAVILNDGDY